MLLVVTFIFVGDCLNGMFVNTSYLWLNQFVLGNWPIVHLQCCSFLGMTVESLTVSRCFTMTSNWVCWLECCEQERSYWTSVMEVHNPTVHFLKL
jgi:hypothetical protein